MVAHLNIHTSFDLLDSSLRIDALIDKAKKEGYRALAITDTNVLYGYPKFYDAVSYTHLTLPTILLV